MGRDVDLFRKLEEESYSVFRDKRVLRLDFVPDLLVSRGKQEERLARILTRGVAKGYLPSVVRVFGRPGVGKTMVVRSVLERFEGFRRGDFKHFYVNLKGCRTVFMAANAVLVAVCGRRIPSNLGLDRVFNEFWGELRALKDERLYVCIVLDEVESIFLDKHYDPNDFLYRLIRHQIYLEDADILLCLIVITNNPFTFEENLDARVKSSMGDEPLMFNAYTEGQLKEILEARGGDAFKPGMMEDYVPGNIARVIAERMGDARRAIDLLRICGEVANERGSKVDDRCLEDALQRAEGDWLKQELGDLPMASAVVLGVIALLMQDAERTTTRDVLDTYSRLIFSPKNDDPGSSLRFLGERRIREIITELDTTGLVSTWNVSRGRKGYRKEIKLNLNPNGILDYYANVHEKFRFELVRQKH